MPTNRQVLGNYAFLFKDHKGSQERVKIIIADIEMLWNETLDFPIFSRALIRKKLNRLIDMSSKNKKNPTELFTKSLSELFDVTNTKGEWKNSEDKDLYLKQRESKGAIGYSTGKKAPNSSIHPRKRMNICTNPSAAPVLGVYFLIF